MLSTMSTLDEQMAYIEFRAMSENMKPFELVRQLIETLDSYDPQGDATWPMRTIRDFMLDYMRALSMRYKAMQGTEKIQL